MVRTVKVNKDGQNGVVNTQQSARKIWGSAFDLGKANKREFNACMRASHGGHAQEFMCPKEVKMAKKGS